MKHRVVVLVVLALIVMCGVLFVRYDFLRNHHLMDQTSATDSSESQNRVVDAARPSEAHTTEHADSQLEYVVEDASEENSSEEPLMTEAEKREAEEEKRVEVFDSLTDRWQEPSAKGVSMTDIEHFAKAFRQIPKPRQDECIHRALNLIPDENVMLLAGVLMDKAVDQEIVETVFNDILNRDEDVKQPILREIFKDKTHPCWTDTAWILDVTGELKKPE